MSKCTPPFCDGMPKSNQNPSSKGGGGKDRRNCANSAEASPVEKGRGGTTPEGLTLGCVELALI